MFFQCPKCKKIWSYPIDKCPECFLELERMKSEKMKVIGISRVTIPTLLHPNVPYFVLVLEDENGNRSVQKFTPHRNEASGAGSEKEYKIGEEFIFQKSQDKNAVATWRIKYDILEGVEKVIKLLGGLTLNENLKVLILPTLITPTHPYFRDNTSPEFLEAILKFLTAKGVKAENIKVTGQSFDENPIEVCAVKSQLVEVCQRFKIAPLDLAKTNFVKKAKDGFNFEIAEEVFSSDLIINLPILKIGKVSAPENILKILKKENYLGLKYLFSEAEIRENLNKVLPNYLTIAEANFVQKSDEFTTFLGIVLASFNSLNLDRVFAEIVMSLPEELKNVNIENIPVIGRQIGELKYDVEKFWY